MTALDFEEIRGGITVGLRSRRLRGGFRDPARRDSAAGASTNPLYHRPMRFHPGSDARLTHYDLGRFAGATLFDRLGRAVCRAECLPRKELFEAWEVARRTRRRCRGGRVVDAAGGHGLLAFAMVLLDDTSPGAIVVDPAPPPSSEVLARVLVEEWPRLAGRVERVTAPLTSDLVGAGDLVVSCHACGALTDRVLDAAIAVRARVAVLPCCHDGKTCDPGPLLGWMDLGLAIDTMRAHRLTSAGYRVWTSVIPEAITAKHRLLIGLPDDGAV